MGGLICGCCSIIFCAFPQNTRCFLSALQQLNVSTGDLVHLTFSDQLRSTLDGAKSSRIVSSK